MSALPPQTVLQNGRYRLENLIGRGGFGLTYRAFDTQNERFVAIKECFPGGCERQNLNVLPGDFASHGQLGGFRALFREQFSRLSSLSHPAMVPFFECFDENGTTYLVMRLLSGPTLLQQIERDGPLEFSHAQALIEEVGDALEKLHERGFLHLDIKPENIILEEGAPVLVDFDLLCERDCHDFRTRPLALAAQIGTPGYAPLEQYAVHAPLGAATDFYALGATFFHLLTGNAPLSAVDRAAGMDFQIPPAIAPQARAFLESALQLQSQDRPQKWSELREIFARSDDDFAPVATPFDGDKPRFASHAQGLYRIVLREKEARFPSRCVCCFAKSPTESWTLNSPSGRWVLPLCNNCTRHQSAAKQADVGMFGGMISSLFVALGGMAWSYADQSFWPISLCLVALVQCFSAMSYGALKSSRAEEMLSDFCAHVSEPAIYVFNGQVHIWKFRNSNFAADFREANLDFVA